MAAAGPTHYQAFFLEVQWEDGLPSLADSGLLREYVPLGLPFTQSLHFSPLEELLHRDMLVVSEEKKGNGEGNQEKIVSYFFSKHVAEQSRTDV